jgi:hypothetical protein
MTQITSEALWAIIITIISMAMVAQALISGFQLPIKFMSWIYGPDPGKWPKIHDAWTPFFCAPCFSFWGSLVALIVQGIPGGILITFAASCAAYVLSKFIYKTINH